MIVFLNTMKRILKNKAQIVVMLILPLLPVIPIAMGTPSAAHTIIVGVVDEDGTILTTAFTDALKSNCKVISVEKDKIETGLFNATMHYAIVIEKGFTENMIKSNDGMRKTSDSTVKASNSMITGYTKMEMDFTPLISGYVDSFINPVSSIAAASGGNIDKFYKGLKYFNEGTLTVNSELVGIPDRVKANSAWGMIIQFMMFSSVFTATLLITDKENKTFFRTLSASISMKSYMFQSILSFLAIAILQSIVLLAVTVAGFGVYPGISVFYMFVLFTVFSLVSVSMGIAISSISRNTIQASIYGAGIVILMCVMGGAWGTLPPSGIIRNLSKLMPVTWAMESVDQLINDASLVSITGHLGILLLFTVVFFLLGTWRKADISK